MFEEGVEFDRVRMLSVHYLDGDREIAIEFPALVDDLPPTSMECRVGVYFVVVQGC